MVSGEVFLFGDVYTRLFQWAAVRELVNENTIAWHLYHDDPTITEDKKLRVMVWIPVMDSVDTAGSGGIATISGGKFDGVVKSLHLLRYGLWPDARHTTCMSSRLAERHAL